MHADGTDGRENGSTGDADFSDHEVARDYLKRPSLSVAEVATLLGFSEPGNFSQAFKRWSNGLSPRQFRQSLQSG